MGKAQEIHNQLKRKVTYSLKSTVKRKPCIPIKLKKIPTSRAKGTGRWWYSPILTQFQYGWSLWRTEKRGEWCYQTTSAKKNARSRNHTKTTGPGQWNKHGIQARDNGNQDDISARPTWWPQAEHSGKNNPNMERPLHFSLQRCLRTLPNAPMVQAHPTSRETVVTTQANKYQPKNFGFRLPLRPAWL